MNREMSEPMKRLQQEYTRRPDLSYLMNDLIQAVLQLDADFRTHTHTKENIQAVLQLDADFRTHTHTKEKESP